MEKSLNLSFDEIMTKSMDQSLSMKLLRKLKKNTVLFSKKVMFIFQIKHPSKRLAIIKFKFISDLIAMLASV